ncbi:MAG: hypothetical protein AAGF12_01290 [Myxococcota bacterium]
MRVGVWGMLGTVLLLACGPGGSGPDDPATCANPVESEFSTVMIGPDGRDPTDFVPYADGDELRVVRGLQGSLMAPVRVALEGPALPECIAQRTVIERDSMILAEDDENLQLFEANGLAVSEALLLIPRGDLRGPVVVTTTVGSTVVQRTLE